MKAAPLGEIAEAPPGSSIGGLKTQYETLSREYSKRLLTLRPEYPEMQRLKSELDAARDALQKETRNLVAAAYADYEAALLKEQSFQRLLNDQKGEALKTNSSAVLYNALRIDLENKKTLLENLTRRQSETSISSGLKGLDAISVWVVDKAHPPLKPTFPQKRKNVLYGILIGLAGAIGLAFGLEYLNQTVKTSKDVAAATGPAHLRSHSLLRRRNEVQGAAGGIQAPRHDPSGRRARKAGPEPRRAAGIPNREA